MKVTGYSLQSSTLASAYSDTSPHDCCDVMQYVKS